MNDLMTKYYSDSFKFILDKIIAPFKEEETDEDSVEPSDEQERISA